MRDIAKLKKEELKGLLIGQLQTIKDLIEWAEDNKVPGLFGTLIIESDYLSDRSLVNPKDFMHKKMDKRFYLHSIQKYEEFISELEELKRKFESGYFNQSEKTINADVEKSNYNQTDKEDNEKGNYNQIVDNDSPEEKSNLIQTNDENSNQNQNKRGGKRVGAGRKGFGETRKVSITLPSETWAMIEELCEKGNLKQSKVLRDIIERGIN